MNYCGVRLVLLTALTMLAWVVHAFVMDPATPNCASHPDCYEVPAPFPAHEPDRDDVQALTDKTRLAELDKIDYGIETESDPFAFFHTTTSSNDPTDPAAGPAGDSISWNGTDGISCPVCVLLVKTGSAEANWYVFVIKTWDGMENMIMQNFCIGPGAVSNVVIFGNSLTPLPEPTPLVLLSLGLIGISLTRRNKCA